MTVTTFFDDKLNEIGEKIENTNENTVFVTVREYKETKPAGSTISGDYTGIVHKSDIYISSWLSDFSPNLNGSEGVVGDIR